MSKFAKTLKLALHKNTDENEAIAAFRAARRIINNDEDILSQYDLSENQKTYCNHCTYDANVINVEARFLKVFNNEVMEFAFENNIHINIQMNEKGIEEKFKTSVLITSLHIKAKGPRNKIDILENIINGLIDWMNEYK